MSTPVTHLPSVASAPAHEEDRVALSKDALKHAFLDNLFYIQGKFPTLATKTDYYMALAYAVRDRIMQRWISTASAYTRQGSRTVSYLSAEFLMGPHLGNNLINLGIYETARTAVAELGLDLEELLAHEDEPGLGNGGLGRLAACFIDSLATLEVPALGYGIRYEFGIFQQEIVDGWQVEKTDKWLRCGNPWEIARPEWCQRSEVRRPHRSLVRRVPSQAHALGAGPHRQRHSLRHAHPRLPREHGEHAAAVEGRGAGVLRLRHLQPRRLLRRGQPEGGEREPHQGSCIRTTSRCAARSCALEQQYFFVSCSLQDMLRICQVQKIPPERFHEKFAVQMNDTHPSIAVAELMRLLVDELHMDWERAWSITRQTFGYTNHTLLPEALERWPVGMFGKLLPRLLEIIYEINARFLDEVRMAFFGDEERIKRLSLIDEAGERYVRMAHLASVGSHAINGVAALHSELLKSDVLRDFAELWPEKFSNKTNGVTPRRWMVLANPRLAHCITQRIGDEWMRDLSQLRKLEPLAEDADFRAEWRQIKHANKTTLAGLIERTHRGGGRSRSDLRRAGQAHPRIQAPAPEHPARDRAVSPAQDRSEVHHGAARVRLRRQGGAGISPRQAHHSSDHRGGRDHQSRSGRARPHQGGVTCRTSM